MRKRRLKNHQNSRLSPSFYEPFSCPKKGARENSLESRVEFDPPCDFRSIGVYFWPSSVLSCFFAPTWRVFRWPSLKTRAGRGTKGAEPVPQVHYQKSADTQQHTTITTSYDLQPIPQQRRETHSIRRNTPCQTSTRARSEEQEGREARRLSRASVTGSSSRRSPSVHARLSFDGKQSKPPVPQVPLPISPLSRLLLRRPRGSLSTRLRPLPSAKTRRERRSFHHQQQQQSRDSMPPTLSKQKMKYSHLLRLFLPCHTTIPLLLHLPHRLKLVLLSSFLHPPSRHLLFVPPPHLPLHRLRSSRFLNPFSSSLQRRVTKPPRPLLQPPRTQRRKRHTKSLTQTRTLTPLPLIF